MEDYVKAPHVSIIIPTYNRAKLIGETLNSILEQTYQNWECLVIDDGSTDNTEEVLKEYIRTDIRFQYHSKPAKRLKGGNAARNYGFEMSRGEFIHWFDSDDIMDKYNIEKKVQYLVRNEDCDYCFCKIAQFYREFKREHLLEGEKSLKISKNVYEDYILGKVSILNVAPMWRKSALINSRLYDETINQLQDLDFISRIIFKNRNVGILDENLIYVRRGNESITTRENQQKIDVNSFLKVKKRIIDRTPFNRNIVLFSIRSVLWAMRWKMAIREYSEAEKCLRFNFQYIRYLSLKNGIKLVRVFIVFYVFKNLKKGDTKFKSFLKI